MPINLSCLVIVKSVERHLLYREGEVLTFTGLANEASLWLKTNEGESGSSLGKALQIQICWPYNAMSIFSHKL